MYFLMYFSFMFSLFIFNCNSLACAPLPHLYYVNCEWLPTFSTLTKGQLRPRFKEIFTFLLFLILFQPVLLISCVKFMQIRAAHRRQSMDQKSQTKQTIQSKVLSRRKVEAHFRAVRALNSVRGNMTNLSSKSCEINLPCKFEQNKINFLLVAAIFNFNFWITTRRQNYLISLKLPETQIVLLTS